MGWHMRKTNNSMTVHRECGCGTLHLTLEYCEEYKPVRVGITLGKAGGCASCQLQALQNSLNERLSEGHQIEYVYDKRNDNSWIGMRCPQLQREEEANPIDHEDERLNLSCPDVIAKIVRYALGKLEEHKEDKKKKKK